MHIISRRKLREFWRRHPRARRPLEEWYQTTRHAEWESLADVKDAFPSADVYRRWVIFDIGGSKYRLIAVIHYNRKKVFVRHVLTHEEYDIDAWKDE